jgi:hypothetical protein
MSNKKEKRKLLKEDLAFCDKITNDLVKFTPVLQEIKRSYEALELGLFDNTVFQKLKLIGPSEYIKLYEDNLNAQLDSLKITSKIIRHNMMASHIDIIEALKVSVENAKGFSPDIYGSWTNLLSVKFISFNGSFIISPENREAILETYCRVYIDELDFPALDMAKELESAYNKYLKYLEDQNVLNINKFDCLDLLFDCESEKISVDYDKLKYLTTCNQAPNKYN